MPYPPDGQSPHQYPAGVIGRLLNDVPLYERNAPSSVAPPAPPQFVLAGTLDVCRETQAERTRQLTHEAYSCAQDDQHTRFELAGAAAVYAFAATGSDEDRETLSGPFCQELWPFEEASFKLKDRRRDLIRAAALIVAEIERLDRAAGEVS